MGTIEDLCNKVCGEIPKGWEISITLEKDAGYVELFHQGIGYVEYPTNYESVLQQVEDALEYAKEQQ